jgi:phenylalanyl-tRNA synthetase beta chain
MLGVTVTAPFWRADIHILEDVVEEIGRLNGFDLIAPTLPRRDFTAVRPSEFDQLRAKIRAALARAGANEALTYSFVHGNVLEKAGQKP